jgi:NADPH-dependent ferric siderophore reductase
LRNVVWSAGDKIQVQLGGWTQRTYTPLDWDADAGRTRILNYLHADGPGTQWARAALRLAQPQPPLIFLGDETSVGLAAALAPRQMLFEMSAPAASAAVLATPARFSS